VLVFSLKCQAINQDNTRPVDRKESMRQDIQAIPFMRWGRVLHSMPAIVVLISSMTACSRETPAPSGEALYGRYCASCHGPAGKGDGPVAPALGTPPADLTTLAKRSGGSFDEAEVMGAIDGRRSIAGHGTREMPVWGAVFEQELKDSSYPGYTGMLRSRVLTEYLRTLQQ
jgi:hypothetical protein